MLDFSIYLLYRAGRPSRALFRCASCLPWEISWAGGLAALPEISPPRAAKSRDRFRGRNVRGANCGGSPGATFKILAPILVCGVKMASMPPESLARYVETENLDAIHQELRAGRPVILLLSHIGNWELFAQLIPHYANYARIGTIYQKLGNRYIDRDVSRKRARTGAELFDRGEGFHKPIELLRAGGLIGILGDQHAGDHGLWTPFFGRLASTSPLPGLLAKRTGATVIAAAVHTEGPARWRMVFTPRVNGPQDSVGSLTWKGNQTIEQQIRKAPEDWFWVHNRWKTPNPNFLLTALQARCLFAAGNSGQRPEAVPDSDPRAKLAGRQRYQRPCSCARSKPGGPTPTSPFYRPRKLPSLDARAGRR